jgi:MSHA biogenesis protein MshG
MAQFSYKARNASGQAINGQLEAGSQSAAAQQLLNSGITPIEITAESKPGEGPSLLSMELGSGRPTLADMVLFSRQMYALTKAGVPIIRGLTQLSDTTRSRGLKAAIEAISTDLESGRDLAGAMARHPRIFGPLFVNMVRVGEESGRLEEAFQRMYEYLEHERTTVNQIKSALRYPSFVIISIVLAVGVLMRYVIPKFADVYAGFDAELPLPTRILIGTSDFVVNWWWAIIVLAFALVLLVLQFVNSDKGRLWWDEKKLKLPLVGDIILRASLSRFSRAFSMASRSGVPLIQALTVVSRAVDNRYLEQKVLGMRGGIERGESITRVAANARIFTPLVLQMLAVGEETGQVDDMLEEVADFYASEVEYDVARLGEIIQPVLIVAIGIIVFIMALGVFLPMWDLMQAVRG